MPTMAFVIVTFRDGSTVVLTAREYLALDAETMAEVHSARIVSA